VRPVTPHGFGRNNHHKRNPAVAAITNHPAKTIGKARGKKSFGAWQHKTKVFSRSHDAVIRVYDAAGNVIATHEHSGEFKQW
jgi:hypothetical protein